MSERTTQLKNRMKQARESLEEAKDLLVEDAAVNFVMNSLYYAFLYAVFGLLELKGMHSTAQSEAISLFEHAYVQTGDIEPRFLEAIRAAFEIRPVCHCEGRKPATAEDVEQLLPLADEFLNIVERTPGMNAES